jgi:outer membrane biogenesis lipoprotein LolB
MLLALAAAVLVGCQDTKTAPPTQPATASATQTAPAATQPALTEQQAREMASALAVAKDKKQKVKPTDWTVRTVNDRWVLQAKSEIGSSIAVSFLLDGGDPKIQVRQ